MTFFPGTVFRALEHVKLAFEWGVYLSYYSLKSLSLSLSVSRVYIFQTSGLLALRLAKETSDFVRDRERERIETVKKEKVAEELILY